MEKQENKECSNTVQLDLLGEKVSFLKMFNTISTKFGGHIIVSYEGTDVGTIYIKDIDKSLVLNKDQFIILDYIPLVKESVTNGVIKYFMNTVMWEGSPPLTIYRLKHII